jgi:hypothetical protein
MADWRHLRRALALLLSIALLAAVLPHDAGSLLAEFVPLFGIAVPATVPAERIDISLARLPQQLFLPATAGRAPPVS